MRSGEIERKLGNSLGGFHWRLESQFCSLVKLLIKFIPLHMADQWSFIFPPFALVIGNHTHSTLHTQHIDKMFTISATISKSHKLIHSLPQISETDPTQSDPSIAYCISCVCVCVRVIQYITYVHLSLLLNAKCLPAKHPLSMCGWTVSHILSKVTSQQRIK